MTASLGHHIEYKFFYKELKVDEKYDHNPEHRVVSSTNAKAKTVKNLIVSIPDKTQETKLVGRLNAR